MSEFTDGILFLQEKREAATQAAVELTQPYFIRDLNKRWSGIFPKDANVRRSPLHEWLVRYSMSFPLLYFEHPTDHGWGYKLFWQGAMTASLWVNYELKYSIWRRIAEQRYPGVDVHIALSIAEAQAINDEVEHSELYQRAVQQQYNSVNVAEFAVFGFTSEHIQLLGELLTAQRYLETRQSDGQVEEFKRIVDIREMTWMSYRYIQIKDADGDEPASDGN